MNLIKYAIRLSWGADTAYKPDTNDFINNHPSASQCAVSAVVLNDLVGGVIKKGTVNGLIKHYWNCVNGDKIDLTSAQFNSSISITNEKVVNKQELLKNKYFYNRYIILKSRVEKFINNYHSIEKSVSKCKLCIGTVDKFTNNSVYFGNTNKILLVGEAPARNGWHVSGKVWRTTGEKIIPSGKRLNSLLSLCDIDLFDCSFIEAIKCHPINQSNLNYQAKNCYDFLIKQISLLSPKIIVTLGKTPTKILVADKSPFSSLVGKPNILHTKQFKFVIFPIYHPSPISPKSLKGNLPLMPKLKELLNGDENND